MTRPVRHLAPLFAALALVPAMIGPLPAEAATISARLCGGGIVEIPVGEGGGGPVGERDCRPKGCHAGTCRERHEPGRAQRPN